MSAMNKGFPEISVRIKSKHSFLVEADVRAPT